MAETANHFNDKVNQKEKIEVPQPLNAAEIYQTARPSPSPNRKKSIRAQKSPGIKKVGPKAQQAAIRRAIKKKTDDFEEATRGAIVEKTNQNQAAAGQEKDLSSHVKALLVYQEPLPLTKLNTSSKQRLAAAISSNQESSNQQLNIVVKNSDLFAQVSQTGLSSPPQQEKQKTKNHQYQAETVSQPAETGESDTITQIEKILREDATEFKQEMNI